MKTYGNKTYMDKDDRINVKKAYENIKKVKRNILDVFDKNGYLDDDLNKVFDTVCSLEFKFKDELINKNENDF